jgi:hypothetical protein
LKDVARLAFEMGAEEEAAEAEDAFGYRPAPEHAGLLEEADDDGFAARRVEDLHGPAEGQAAGFSNPMRHRSQERNWRRGRESRRRPCVRDRGGRGASRRGRRCPPTRFMIGAGANSRAADERTTAGMCGSLRARECRPEGSGQCRFSHDDESAAAVLFRIIPKKRSKCGMSRSASKTTSDYPEFVVMRESFNRYFERGLPTSTFHDLVKKGKIIPMNSMRGFFLLNASLRRLGLKEVAELPRLTSKQNLENVTRLAFTLIDRDLFPPPPWLHFVEVIDLATCDHALRIAEQHRSNVEAFDHIMLKLAYFGGALDAAAMMEADHAGTLP